LIKGLKMIEPIELSDIPYEKEFWSFKLDFGNVTIYEDGLIVFTNGLCTFDTEELAEIVRRSKLFRDRRTFYKENKI
jgi:hypothetical protein